MHNAPMKVGDIVRTANVDLAGGQKHRDADIDQQTAFDLACDGTGNNLTFFDRAMVRSQSRIFSALRLLR